MAKRGTTPWRVVVVPPRPKRGEVNLYLRARRSREGREEEQRCSSGTLNPIEAEVERARFEADLNAGVAGRRPTLPQVMDARIAELEREVERGTKSPHSVEGYRLARARIAQVLDVDSIARPALLRARDQLQALGLGAETTNSYLRRAASCWRWAEEREIVVGAWPRVRALPKPPRAKRPYTSPELDALLAWVAGWRGGLWLPLLSLVAETGRRVGEVCSLKGRDLDRREGTLRVRQKGARMLMLPVSPEVLALLPERKPDEWMFPRPQRGGGTGPARPDAVRTVVRRAIKALKIPDGERLDTHSLRRSFAADAHRAGVPDDVTRRLTGHESQAMLMYYQRETVGDDLREAQEQVRAYRASRRASPGSSPASPEEAGVSVERRGIRTPDPILVSSPRTEGELVVGHGPGKADGLEAQDRSSSNVRASSLGDRLFARRDPLVARVAGWADEDPMAMRCLLTDPVLRAQLLDALNATAPSMHAVQRDGRDGGDGKVG